MSAPRPERILPTEPGWWYYKSPIGGDSIAVQVYRAGPPRRGKLLDAAEGTLMADEDEVTWGGYDWLCPIPTPEKLSAMEAQLAAGQALGDALRGVVVAENLRFIGIDMVAPDVLAFLAAFPPVEKGGECGARPKRPHGSVIEMEPKSSPQIVDLAAALRRSLDRKGGAR